MSVLWPYAEKIVIDILPTLALCTKYSNPGPKNIRLWSLVLSARHVAHRAEFGTRLLVAPSAASRAMAEIMAYEGENHPRSKILLLPVHNVWITLLPIAIFMCILLWSETWDLGVRLTLKQEGLAHAGSIRGGQWWRCVTALFLHADSAHLFSNLAALMLLAPFVARRLGSGLSWGLFMATGGLGNAINAWIQPVAHLSLGASTGVFGFIGVLAGQSAWIEPGQRARTMLRTFGFGLGFLALLGAGDGQSRVDLGAHFFGLLVGLGLGMGLGYWEKWKLYSPAANKMVGGAALGIVTLAWALVLHVNPG